MSTPLARFIVADVLDGIRQLPAESVDLILTSPPFLAQRSYLPMDDPLKDREFGREVEPGRYVDHLLEVIEEADRILAPHGSLVIELADSYSGSGGSGGDYNPGGKREGQVPWQGTAAAARVVKPTVSIARDRYAGSDSREGWPLAKSLTLVPELLRIALAYGCNPLTGRTTPRWRIRNVVRWCKPDPAVGRLSDKFRPATAELLVATRGKTRYFDLDGVSEEPKHGFTMKRRPVEHAVVPGQPQRRTNPSDGNGGRINSSPAGAPPLDWWVIASGGGGKTVQHYATWPMALLTKPIKAMCPERVCTSCGLPSVRLGAGGWSDCGHDSWRRGVVLDPFAGSGTTLAAAVGLGRSAIGIDIDERNADIARARVGLFLEVAGVA